MLRMLGYLIMALVALSLLRTVIGIVAKIFSGDGPSAGKTARKTEVPAGGVLRKDPVCGTYVPEQTSRKLLAGGETVFFCSDECLKKYREAKGG